MFPFYNRYIETWYTTKKDLQKGKYTPPTIESFCLDVKDVSHQQKVKNFSNISSVVVVSCKSIGKIPLLICQNVEG